MSKLTICAATCLQVVLLLVLKGVFHFAEIKIFASPPLENVQHIQTSGLKVRGGVVGLGDEKLRLGARINGGEYVTDLQELLLDGSQQVETGLDLGLGVRRLHRCCHHRHKPTFARHLCCVGNHGDVDVRISSDLLLWDDDLC